MPLRNREKVFFLFLLLTFWTACARADTPFRFADEKTASRKALELFHLCAFYPEYGPEEEQTLALLEESGVTVLLTRLGPFTVTSDGAALQVQSE